LASKLLRTVEMDGTDVGNGHIAQECDNTSGLMMIYLFLAEQFAVLADE
jgi:hypothetical protein